MDVKTRFRTLNRGTRSAILKFDATPKRHPLGFYHSRFLPMAKVLNSATSRTPHRRQGYIETRCKLHLILNPRSSRMVRRIRPQQIPHSLNVQQLASCSIYRLTPELSATKQWVPFHPLLWRRASSEASVGPTLCPGESIHAPEPSRPSLNSHGTKEINVQVRPVHATK